MARIALVDDDRNILTSVSMTLEAEGFEVGKPIMTVSPRWMPLTSACQIWLSLILRLPRMDGMDLLQRLRQKTSMPVIF